MSLSPLDRIDGWVFDDVADLPDDGPRYEVVDGRLWPMTPPTVLHDVVCRRLFRQLDRQLPSGWEATIYSGLRLGTDGRIPDVGIVRADVPVRRRQVGSPPEQWLLAVEVVSPSSRKNDRFFKPIEYAQAGVPAYWRIETDPEVFIVVHELVDGAYVERQVLCGVEEVAVPLPMAIDVPGLVPVLLD